MWSFLVDLRCICIEPAVLFHHDYTGVIWVHRVHSRSPILEQYLSCFINLFTHRRDQSHRIFWLTHWIVHVAGKHILVAFALFCQVSLLVHIIQFLLLVYFSWSMTGDLHFVMVVVESWNVLLHRWYLTNIWNLSQLFTGAVSVKITRDLYIYWCLLRMLHRIFVLTLIIFVIYFGYEQTVSFI